MIQPKLRFPEFTDGWLKQTFGDYIIEHSDKTSDKTKYPLYSLTIEEGVVPKSERYEREFLITKEGDSYKIVPEKAFVYNPMNLRFGALKVNHEEFPVSVSGYYNVFSIRNEEVVGFWENYLVSPKMLNYYFSIATGSLIEKLRVHFSQFVKIEKYLPSILEQEKIAKFFSEIDKKIEQQQIIISDYENMKKGLLQKIFNQEIRFKNDNGTNFPEWKRKKIGDLFYKVNERNNGQFDKTKWISVAKMYYQEPDKVTSNNIDTRTYVMRVGDMAFEGHPNSEFLFGRFVVNDLGDGVISELFPIYRHKTDYVLKYWKYAIQVESIMAHIYRKCITSSGASSNKINDNDFLRESIVVPCVEEQQKIASFLTMYDKKIEAEKKILEDWKQMKKALLQQMFV